MARDKHFQAYLKEIAPYVIVVGSFARWTETNRSDIDCYIKNRPEIERETDYELNQTYMPELIEITHKYGYVFSSCIIGHIAIELDVPRMVELSSLYKIPRTSPITKRCIYGVKMECAVDDKEAYYEDCLGYDD